MSERSVKPQSNGTGTYVPRQIELLARSPDLNACSGLSCDLTGRVSFSGPFFFGCKESLEPTVNKYVC
jgi:hypothetical protein